MTDLELNQKIRHSLTRFLARREHSCKELRQKLEERGFPLKSVDQELSKFVENDIQSDHRFAESLVKSAYSKGKGPNYINQQLQHHEISCISLNELLSAEFDWFELAEKVRVKRFGSEIPSDWNTLQKQKRFLQGRGFTLEQIDAAF